jgi:flagellar hook assembly protein FlgD
MRRMILAVVVVGALLLSAGTAFAAISVTTYPANPLTIHLNSAPKCTSLRYKLSARAEDVELKIINSTGREVWDVDRESTGLSAGVVHSFSWCGQREGGGKVSPGTFRWHVEADQAGTEAEGRSVWRTVTVVR